MGSMGNNRYYETIEKLNTLEECCRMETKIRKEINKDFEKLTQLKNRKAQIINTDKNQLKFDI